MKQNFILINIFIMIIISLLTSCYSSANLGFVQKINDANSIVQLIHELVL